MFNLLSTIGELRPDRAIAYFTQLASAVEGLHAANVVHRAIRPRSVWVGKVGIGVKLGNAAWYQRIIDLHKAEPWLVGSADDELPEAW